ncbi:histidinol dehydrogenase [Barrientosiimonas marina]|uniref:Histidinol dehydrogenase n=1 Tax=Lentibacillus kimchii TaxID=1542911 RepID=A0ABW2UW18_9BACI
MEIMTQEQFAERQGRRQPSGGHQQLDEAVQAIIRQVQQDGDRALFDLTAQFDGVQLADLAVSRPEINAARENVTDAFMDALAEARDNITAFHEAQQEASWFLEQTNAKQLGQKVTPIEKVGLYIPGGTAAYPSTVLMNAIPARIAGVKQIIMTTPPGPDGRISDEVLAAADLAGVTAIYKLGGAQAIAALAYGTESIDRVSKITGPGNAYVARAKKWVYGDVAIDMIAGPSEICIVADDTAPPSFAAADLLSQAEHDTDAAAICITNSSSEAKAIQAEIEKQIDQLERKAIIDQAFDQHGAIVVVNRLDEAFDIVNDLAPEHLQLMLADAGAYVDRVQNAGAIFLGHYSPEPLGDYFAGPNHTLPTSGTAKFASPLGVYDFIKRTSIIEYSASALEQAADQIDRLARSEQLTAHANSVQIRKEANHAAKRSQS